jgi:hypothetical protein
MRISRRGRFLRVARGVRALACMAIAVGLATSARAQTSPAERAMPELEEARSMLSRMQQYKSACEDLRNSGPDYRVPANSLLSAFRDDKLFLTAIGSYCASGIFGLDAASKQGCTERRKVTEQQLEFVRHLPAVRTDTPLRQIRLECVELQGPLSLMHLESGGLFMKDVTAVRIFVALSRLPNGVRLDNVTVANGVGLYALSIDTAIEIFKAEIGTHTTWGLALGIVDTSVRSVTISQKSQIKGKLDLSGAKIASSLRIADVEVAGDVVLNHMHVDRIHVSRATFAQGISAEHAHIDKQFSIGDKTTLTGNFWGEHIQADDLRVEGVKLGKSFTLNRAKIGLLRFVDSETVNPNCPDCSLNLWDASVLHLTYQRNVGLSVFAGNGRFRTLAVSGGSIPKFDCSDCLVEQYMLLASRMTGRTSLVGADIKGSLTFSEGLRRACWTGSATLDLSELRADVVAVSASDLLQLSKDAPSNVDCTDASKPPTVSTSSVPTRLSGARYRAITPARLNSPTTDGPKYKITPLVGLPAEGLVDLIKSGRASLGEGYDPQPYEELAEALTRAGEGQKARDLRIAKFDDWLAHTEMGWLRRGFYWSYRFISRYGFENERAAVIFLCLLALGVAIHLHGRKDVVVKLARMGSFGTLLGIGVYSIWYSLDRAIPPLHLDAHMHEVRGQHWSLQHYFYLHRVLGTYLISVFAAGAAGFGH